MHLVNSLYFLKGGLHEELFIDAGIPFNKYYQFYCPEGKLYAKAFDKKIECKECEGK